jgi:sugar phosphate isomerase/epimerase
MRLAVSNIAWTPDDDAIAAAALTAAGVHALEVAPTVRWPAPLEVPRAEAAAWRAWWHDRGIDVVAMQSLLFGRPDLVVFGPPDVRAALVDYLGGICRLAAWLGATRLVFGSPANRRPGDRPGGTRRHRRGRLPRHRARAPTRRRHGLHRGKSRAYGCEWIQSVSEAAALVTAVGHPDRPAPRCRRHACTATRSTTSPARSRLPACGTCMQRPSLAALGEGDSRAAAWHADLAALLAQTGYDGCVSLEMRRQDGDRAALLAASLGRLTAWYGAAPRTRR